MTAVDDRFVPLMLRLSDRFGFPVTIANDDVVYTAATGAGVSTIEEHHTPPVATVLGKFAAAAGSFGDPTGNTGDAFVVREGDNWVIYFTTHNDAEGGTGIARVSKAYSATDLHTGWGNAVLVSSKPELFVPPVAAQPSADACDTPSMVYHETLKRWFLYHTVRPGSRATGVGTIDSIAEAHTDDNPPTAATVFVRNNTSLITANATWSVGFSATEGGNTTWRGGVGQSCGVWDPDLGIMVLFFGGFTEDSVGGPWTWSLGRALESGGDGVTFVVDADAVFVPQSHILSGWAAATTGPHHFHVLRDPRDGIYHLLMTDSAADAVGHFYSRDKGQTWTANPANPLMTTTTINTALGGGTITELGAPFGVIDEDAGTNGKFYICCDGGAVQRYASGFLVAAESARPVDPWKAATMFPPRPISAKLKSKGTAFDYDTAGMFAASGLALTPRIGTYGQWGGITYRAVRVDELRTGELVAGYRCFWKRA